MPGKVKVLLYEVILKQFRGNLSNSLLVVCREFKSEPSLLDNSFFIQFKCIPSHLPCIIIDTGVISCTFYLDKYLVFDLHWFVRWIFMFGRAIKWILVLVEQ